MASVVHALAGTTTARVPSGLGLLTLTSAKRQPAGIGGGDGQVSTSEEWWDYESTRPSVTMATRFETSAEVTNWRHIDGQQANVTHEAGGGVPGTSGGALKMLIPAATGANPGAWRRPLSDAFTQNGDGFLNDEFYVVYRVFLGPQFLRPSNGGAGHKLAIISGLDLESLNSSASAQAFEVVNQLSVNSVAQQPVFNFYHSINQTFYRSYGGQAISLQPGLDWGSGLPDDRRYSYYKAGSDYSSGTLRPEEGVWISVKVRLRGGLYDGPNDDSDPANDVNELDVWVAWPGDTSWRKVYDNAAIGGFYLGPNDGVYTGGFSGLWFTGYETSRTNAGHNTWYKVTDVIVSRSDISCPPPIEAAPSWYTAMTPKTWARPVSNTLSSIYVAGDGGLPASGLDAWSCGTSHQRLGSIRKFGGGHGDNDVNSVFECILRTASPAWARLTSPSSNSGGSAATGVYGDGQPRSPHSWHQLAYVPNSGTWMAPLPGTYSSGANSGRFFTFSDSGLTWTARGYAPGTNSATTQGDADTLGHARYDQFGGLLVVSASQGAFWTIDPQTYTATSGGATNSTNYYMTAALASERRLFLIWHPSSGALRAYNLDADTLHTVTISGTGPSGAENYGMVWHAPSGAFLVWGQTSGTATLYKLTPPSAQSNTFSDAYTWSTVSADASNAITPSAPSGASNAMPTMEILSNFGGLRDDLLVVHNGVSSNVECYRLPVGGV